jgi:hypothetical protein
MLTTRSPHLLRRLAGLLAVPALLLTAAACGDDDDSAGGGSFCDQARSLEAQFEDIDDPTSEEFSAALDAIRDMDPPAEIAEDWETMVSALDVFNDIDIENPDPSVLEEFEAEAANMEAASERVGTYMEEECGFTLD